MLYHPGVSVRRLLGEVIRAPTDTLERIHTRAARDRERTVELEPGVDWRQLIAGEPARVDAEFEEIWTSIVAAGVDRHDAGRQLAEALYTLVRAAAPERVVETGVARGVTSRVLLEALERNGVGQLWSIDLPPQFDDLTEARDRIIPPTLRTRWRFLEGSSRRVLPGLLDRLGWIDVFVHDSAHTERNMRFEMTHAWPALRSGGWLVVDDAHSNPAFADFAREKASTWSAISESAKGTTVAFARR